MRLRAGYTRSESNIKRPGIRQIFPVAVLPAKLAMAGTALTQIEFWRSQLTFEGPIENVPSRQINCRRLEQSQPMAINRLMPASARTNTAQAQHFGGQGTGFRPVQSIAAHLPPYSASQSPLPPESIQQAQDHHCGAQCSGVQVPRPTK